jgi:hypothetical protein
MGESPEEADNTVSVRITRNLLESLTGRATTIQRTGRGAPGVARRERERFPRLEQSSVKETINYGNLLLKHEGHELESITQFANELIEREHVQPPKAVPCKDEMQACFACYKENIAKDVSACSKVAADYHRCAQEAQ